MKIILFIALAFFAALAFAEPQESEIIFQFGKFVEKHRRQYSSDDEFGYRYRVFKKNYLYINDHNTNHAKNLGFTLKVNSFADLTNSEFREKYLGVFNNATRIRAPIVHKSSVAAPSSVDWRTKGVVTPIKNQGQCGSCWSFSTTGSVEGAHALKTGQLVSLSEQNLMDCSTSYGNQGCNGGLMDYAFKYIIDNKGVDTESSYPYTAQDGRCKFKSANVGATISNYADVQSGDENGLLTAAAQQPVSVAIDASHSSFQFYESGVYYEARCSASQLDHGVLVVGYGTLGSSDYWLVKNSWGADWGNQGYIYMSRNRKNNCGIATAASYPIA